jgi:hypothetical protein
MVVDVLAAGSSTLYTSKPRPPDPAVDEFSQSLLSAAYKPSWNCFWITVDLSNRRDSYFSTQQERLLCCLRPCVLCTGIASGINHCTCVEYDTILVLSSIHTDSIEYTAEKPYCCNMRIMVASPLASSDMDSNPLGRTIKMPSLSKLRLNR